MQASNKNSGHMPAINGNEQDAFSRYARSIIGAFKRSGIAKFCKRQHSKRVRRLARKAVEGD